MKPNRFLTYCVAFLACAAFLLEGFLYGGTPNPRGALATTWEDVYARMAPDTTARVSGGVSTASLDGKIMCGYQGWFLAPGDGSKSGWVHYGPGVFEPGECTVDLWPDMTEMTSGERYATDFRNQDGSVATVFSSYNPQTVNRHFRWMAENGIDGVFLQRFAIARRNPRTCDATNATLENVRGAANANGRTWAVMYDLSALHRGEIASLVMSDWKDLVDRMQITRDASYQHHKGKPLVALWGVGFNDPKHSEYTLEECQALIDFLKNDPKYGGNSVMLGVPFHWRALKGDATSNPALLDVLRRADVISPWAVGRYGSGDFDRLLNDVEEPDMTWCRLQRLAYMPVIFPGFRWRNMQTLRHNPLGREIPRERGAFFWEEGSGLIKAGARMLYVAMFDEIDEGTAIFKCTNTPPAGASEFGTYEGLPSDYYLWLAGRLSRALKGEIPLQSQMPSR